MVSAVARPANYGAMLLRFTGDRTRRRLMARHKKLFAVANDRDVATRELIAYLRKQNSESARVEVRAVEAEVSALYQAAKLVAVKLAAYNAAHPVGDYVDAQ